MIRPAVITFLVCIIGWNAIIALKPNLMIEHVGGNRDKTIIKAEPFAYDASPQVIVVGSSLSNRIPRLPDGWYNLSFPGGGPLTGLEIIEKADKIPDTIFIEMNAHTRPVDEELLAHLFHPIAQPFREHLPGMRHAARPSFVLARFIFQDGRLTRPRGRAHLRQSPQDEQADHDDITDGRELREDQTTPMQAIFKDQVRVFQREVMRDDLQALLLDLKACIDRLNEKGIRVVLFEMPESEMIEQTAEKQQWRERVHAILPPQQYHWLPPVDYREYNTTDARHLDRKGARQYARFMSQWLDNQ